MSLVHKAYMEHQDALKRFLWQFYKRAEDVEDAAQEAYIRAFRAELDQEIKDPKAFLFRVARNYALSDLAKKSNTTTDYLVDSDVSPVLEDESHIGADERLESKQKLFLMLQAVAELPPKCRQVFVMRKFEGKRVKDIAEILGVSVSSVDQHVALGLIKCRRYLNAHGFEMGLSKKAKPVPARPEAKASTGTDDE